VAQEIGGDDRMALAEPGDHRLPRRRAARDPVQEDQERATSDTPIAEPVTVEADLGSFHQLTLPSSRRNSRPPPPWRSTAFTRMSFTPWNTIACMVTTVCLASIAPPGARLFFAGPSRTRECPGEQPSGDSCVTLDYSGFVVLFLVVWSRGAATLRRWGGRRLDDSCARSATGPRRRHPGAPRGGSLHGGAPSAAAGLRNPAHTALLGALKVRPEIVVRISLQADPPR
jgi:hypothetical protein